MSKRKNVRTRAIITLCIVFVLTVACAVLGVTGMKLDGRGLYKLRPWMPTTNTDNWPKSLSLGLDLRGGVFVEYSAALPEGSTASFDELMENTISVIRFRLSDQGLSESNVQRIGTNGIRVEIPDVSDPKQILDLIGTPAKMEFKTEDGKTFMDGTMVQTATAVYDSEKADHQIAFTLTGEGAKIFGDVTAQNIGKRISIYLDGEALIEPTVQSAITNGSGVINGMGTAERAKSIASQIQSGALPLVLTQQKVDTVSATLGIGALGASITAGVISLLIVMLIMLLRYRMNGVVASWALVIYIVILFFLLAVIPGIQLTLPGLAGIVLGIGMAVDANVIIYERFNEEVRAGRPLKAAVRAGFQNAMSAILDANVTTLISAIVLLFFGTGSIQGFARTLLLSVVTSMFTAIVVTRFLMNRFVSLMPQSKAMFTSVKTMKGEQN